MEFVHEEDFTSAFYGAHRTMLDGSQILVDFMRAETVPGWVPRRLGGGVGGKKQSGQMRFGGRDCPFHAPYDSNRFIKKPGSAEVLGSKSDDKKRGMEKELSAKPSGGERVDGEGRYEEEKRRERRDEDGRSHRYRSRDRSESRHQNRQHSRHRNPSSSHSVSREYREYGDHRDRREYGDHRDRREYGEHRDRREYGEHRDHRDRREYGEHREHREHRDHRRYEEEKRHRSNGGSHSGERKEKGNDS